MSTEGTLQYRCCMNQCPMYGGIFLSGTQGPGICSHHYGTAGHDIVRVTQVLLDWECVTYEINLCRAALRHVEVDKEAVAKAWTRLQPALAGRFEAELAPAGQDYAQWGRRLERFLDARVKDAIVGAPPA